MPGLEDLLRGMLFNQTPVTDNPEPAMAEGPALPPPQRAGGIFGGMPGWGRDERPIDFADLPAPQPRAETPISGRPMSFAEVPNPQAPPEMPLERAPGGPAPLPMRGPRPQPMEAPQQPGPMPPMPPMGGPPAPQGGMMGALGLTPDRVAMLGRSLSAGLANVRNSPFKGEAFARPAGAAMQGGEKFQDEQNLRADRIEEAAANRDLRARGLDDTAAYRKAQINLGIGNLDVNRRNSDSLADVREAQRNRPDRWNKPAPQLELDFEARVLAKEAALAKKHGLGNLTRYATPDEKAEHQKKAEAAAAELEAYKQDLRKRMGIDQQPGARGGGAYDPAGGKPITREQYNALPPGASYHHPSDPPGVMRKKGGKAAPAAAPAPVEDDEDA